MQSRPDPSVSLGMTGVAMPAGNLGRGLGSLIPKKIDTATGAPLVAAPAVPLLTPERFGATFEIKIEEIQPNPHQPRERFSRGEIDELVASIKKHGLLQPVVVTLREGGGYELIAGERRLRAAKIVGLERVPAVVRGAHGSEKLELALIENIQRQDLTPIEEARAYQKLIQDYGLTQEDVAARVGKARATISNALRLLLLPREVQQAVSDGTLPPTQARVLAGLKTLEEQKKWFEEFLTRRHTVREVEQFVAKSKGHTIGRRQTDVNLQAIEEELRKIYGVKIMIKNKNNVGHVQFMFFSDEEFAEIVRKLRE